VVFWLYTIILEEHAISIFIIEVRRVGKLMVTWFWVKNQDKKIDQLEPQDGEG
jgi:hypothetical protein